MAEERLGSGDYAGPPRKDWLQIFRGFSLAMDINKLVLAAIGILVMALGWWLLALIFQGGKPDWKTDEDYYYANDTNPEIHRAENDKRWPVFKKDRRRWSLRFAAAGPADSEEEVEIADEAETWYDYDSLEKLKDMESATKIEEYINERYPHPTTAESPAVTAKRERILESLAIIKATTYRKSGEMRSWPWSEDRGPNPYLMVSGQAGAWPPGRFWEWLLTDRVPVLMEPLFKLLAPIKYFLKGDIGFINSLYFMLVMLWTVVTWAVVGGAITRIASVQIARQEKITMGEAIRFTMKRLFSFVTAPLFPIVGVAALVIICFIFGTIHWIPWVGEIFDFLLWPLILIFGIAMALGLVGLIGWPLMSATISSEGADSWEAVSRSYSYVYQAPWQYAWYTVVALAYGAVLAFFVGFMGSLSVHLSKWAVAQTPWLSESRDPAFLFVYSPKSYGWRNLLLADVELQDGSPVVNPKTGEIIKENYDKYLGNAKGYKGEDQLSGMNKVGAVLVTVWILLFFMLILGFSYSYFWCAFTLIYFLLRKRVDHAEMDEVYLEEDELEGYSGPLAPPAQGGGSQPPSGGQSLAMVSPPAPSEPAPSAPPAATPAPAPEPEPEPEPTPPPEPEEKADEPEEAPREEESPESSEPTEEETSESSEPNEDQGEEEKKDEDRF